ncbi:MAG: azurin [Pseudomonadota bacterium]
MRSTSYVLLALAATGLVACGGGDSDAGTSAGDAASAAADEATEAAGAAADAAESAAAMAADGVTDAAESAADAATGDGDPCNLSISAGDNISFDKNSMSVPSSCTEVTVTLAHTGNLPAAAMGHNWVLLPTDAVEAVAMAGMNAGVAGNYLPENDERIIAATDLVGGGESTSVTFSLDALEDGTSYTYVCTFPGHWSIMRGSFTVTG